MLQDFPVKVWFCKFMDMSKKNYEKPLKKLQKVKKFVSQKDTIWLDTNTESI
jgi:hypothetical protein